MNTPEIFSVFMVFLGWIHLQHRRIAVALARVNFLLSFGQKTKNKTKNKLKENSQELKQQLYGYATNESPLSFFLSFFIWLQGTNNYKRDYNTYNNNLL